MKIVKNRAGSNLRNENAKMLKLMAPIVEQGDLDLFHTHCWNFSIILKSYFGVLVSGLEPRPV